MFFGASTRLMDPSAALDLDFTGDTPGVFTSYAGRDLTFTRASANGLVQTSASTIGGTAASSNQGLIKSRGVSGRVGHLVRRAYTNVLWYARELDTGAFATNRATWYSTGGTVTYSSSGSSPRVGVTDAKRIEVSSGGFARQTRPAFTVGDRVTASLWRRHHSSSGTHQWTVGFVDGGENVAVGALDSSTATTTWEKRTLGGTVTGNGVVYMCPCDGGGFYWPGNSSIAQDFDIDFVQMVLGRIAYDPLPTSGGTLTSAAETLVSGNATNLMSGNNLSLWYQLVPEAASTAYADHGTMYLFDHIHGGSGLHTTCTIDGSSLLVTLTLYAGSPVVVAFTNPLPAWSDGDLLDIWVEGRNGDQRAKARVNGGTPVSLGTATSTGANFGTTDNLYHLSTSSGASQFDCALARVRSYGSGQRPAWAA